MLTKCPECGHDVSTNAEKCPNCGTPVEAMRELHDEELETKLNNTGQEICTECGYIGRSVSITPGRFYIELCLWLLIVPGILYSFWRLSGRHKGCPMCGGKMIKLTSPMGRKLYREFEERR